MGWDSEGHGRCERVADERKPAPRATSPGREARSRARGRPSGLPALAGPVRPRDWLFALALVAAVFLVYQPAWRGGFILDDDLTC